MIRKFFCMLIIVGLLLGQISCAIKAPKIQTPVEIAKVKFAQGEKESLVAQKLSENQRLPEAVQNALIPGVGNNETPNNSLFNKQFTIHVSAISAQLFFKNLRKSTPYNIVIDPKISGDISLDLKNVTVPQIFDAVRDIYGYDYKQTSFGFEVFAPKLKTQLFRVDYLDVKRDSSSSISVASSDLVNANNVNTGQTPSTGSSSTTTNTPATSQSTGPTSNSLQTSSSIAFWDSLSKSLTALIGDSDGRSVVVNAVSGLVMVKAYPSELREVGTFLARLQASVNRQVILDVSILEVQLNDTYQAGIDWNLLGLVTNMGTPGVGAALPFTTVTMTSGSNSAVINLLQQQGNVQVLSNPRVLTVNNQPSVIKVGSEKYYVTGVTSTPNSSSDGSSTANSSSIALTPFFSGITLNVTPEIDVNSQILLHVHPTISLVTEDDTTISLGSNQEMVLPLAAETLREYDSMVRASNDQLIVIGGMITNGVGEVLASTPGLGSIPVVGNLFRSTTQISSKLELVIILKPHLITEYPEELREQFKEANKNFSTLDRGFHQGGMTDVMGNQAETY